MWKRGGRSSALDRAQVLLSAQRSSGGPAGSVKGSAAQTPALTGTAGGSAHILLSDLSDVSSVSSAPDPGGDTWGSPAAPPAGKSQGREGGSTKDLRPESSLGGGGSKFLKKAPPPASNSSQSPISKSQMQQVPESRYVSSSQTAALSRLAQIESRIRSRKQAAQWPKPAESMTSDLGVSPPPAARSLEASVWLSAQSSSDQSLRGKRFLKNNNNTAAAAAAAAAAASSTQGPDVGVRSRSRAADAVVVSGVSLESDEEDMRKLLGDSLDSLDNDPIGLPGKLFSVRAADKMLGKSNQRVRSTPPPAAVPPSSSSIAAPPRSPASPSHRSSPFRFTGQARARFSPSVLSLSPSPSPSRDSPSPPLGRPNFPHRAASPPRSLSSMSGRSEVLSLEELFPVGPGTEDAHSEMSAVSSEDFKINVMTLDDLVPAELRFPEETLGKEREAKVSAPVSESLNRQQPLRVKENEEGEQQQGHTDLPDYQSDFESESRTEPVNSASQVSERLHGHGDEEEEVVSEVREEAPHSDVSRGRTEDDYSSSFSDTSRSYTSRTSDGSRALSRGRSPVSCGSQTFSQRAPTRKVLKEAAVQTQPDFLAYSRTVGGATLDPAAGMGYIDPTPVFAHTLSAEMVQALSSFNPAVFALNELLKQQLAMTRRFIESSRHLHSSLVRSLEPPNYRYTTLEDTKEYIRRRRPPKLTMEEALDEVQQEMRMRDYHLT